MSNILKKNILYGLIISIASVISLFTFNYFSPTSSLSTCASNLAYPFLVIQERLLDPFRTIFSKWNSYSTMQQKLENYESQNEYLKKELIELKNIFNDIKETEHVREFAKKYQTDYMRLARILLKSMNDKEQIFLIDAGKNKSITRDMVVVYKNFLIGRISKVYNYYSKVILITDKRCKVSAYCVDTGVQGIHEGSNGLSSTQLSFVNHLKKLKKNDLIISSGDGLVFPRGFGLGMLKSFSSNELYYETQVDSLLDLSKLNYCYVLAKGSEYDSVLSLESSAKL